jgi:hypothetical protein
MNGGTAILTNFDTVVDLPVPSKSVTITAYLDVSSAVADVQDGMGDPGWFYGEQKLRAYDWQCRVICESDVTSQLVMGDGACTSCAGLPSSLQDDSLAISVTFTNYTDEPLPAGPIHVFVEFNAWLRGSSTMVLGNTISTGTVDFDMDAVLSHIEVRITPANVR